MQVLKNLSIKFKLFIAYALVFLLIFILSFSLLFFQIRRNLEYQIRQELNQSNQTITDMVETTATVSIKNHLKAIADKNREICTHFYKKFLDGEITESEAREKAIEIFLSQTVGDTGYLYCINSKGIVEVHPQPGVLGQNVSYRMFIQKQISEKEGYLEYEWKNPGEPQERSKALYMTYFKSWDWIISVSSYKSEFIKLIDINDFKERILNLTFGETGYCYIINSQGNIIAHPEISGNAIDLKDAKGFLFAKEMIRQKKGYLTYWWKNPSEKEPREKFVAFDYIPAFDWIVVSSSYTKEVFSPLYEIQKVFLLILALVFLVTAGVTLSVSTTITKPLLEFVHQLENRTPDDWSFRMIHKRSDEIGKLSSSFNRFMDRLETYRQELISEITARKKAEQRHTLLAAVIEQSHDSVLITDQEGRIQYANTAFEQNTGYSKNEVTGKNLMLFSAGSQQENFNKHVWKTLKKGNVWHGSLSNERKDGSSKEEVATILPVKNPEGKIVNYAAIMRDLTQEKNLERQLIQAHKMEAIGTLAGGIAHDFNNILSAILGYTELLQTETSGNDTVVRYSDQILKAGHRAKDLVYQILTFSRQTEQELKPLSVKTIAKETLKLLRASLPSTIEIRQHLTSDSLVMADPTQIHQIVMNVCTNAAYAMQENGGVLELTLKDEMLNFDALSSYSDLKPGNYQKLSVKDTGAGIPEEKLDLIFDPFFTTKEKGEGTGLGLAVVHGIVKFYGGTITVQSKSGMGSVFEIFLPIVESELPLKDDKETDIPKGTEHILVIDDEPDLVDINMEILKKLGYSVSSSTNSQEALTLFQSDPEKFDLVITDMTMPKMTGVKLAKKLLDIKSDIPIILITGFSDGMTEEKALGIGFKGFLMKPLILSKLAVKIREILDGRQD